MPPSQQFKPRVKRSQMIAAATLIQRWARGKTARRATDARLERSRQAAAGSAWTSKAEVFVARAVEGRCAQVQATAAQRKKAAEDAFASGSGGCGFVLEASVFSVLQDALAWRLGDGATLRQDVVADMLQAFWGTAVAGSPIRMRKMRKLTFDDFVGLYDAFLDEIDRLSQPLPPSRRSRAAAAPTSGEPPDVGRLSLSGQ